MLLKLEEGGSPKGRQIVDQVQRLIRDGRLNPVEALPSVGDRDGEPRQT
ncbi:MAG: hypothetical protein HGA66_18505, partial [Holophaga sp.]|nr:hypothetical protein [Holophaga sp.]